jgi:hypothetical protein
MLFFRHLLDRFPRRARPLVESGIYGLATGLAAVAFEIAINWLYSTTLVRFAGWTVLA